MDEVDNEAIKPWLDRAESVFPKSDPKSAVIFQLREKMIKEIQNKSAEKSIGQEEANGDSETQLQVQLGNVCEWWTIIKWMILCSSFAETGTVPI